MKPILLTGITGQLGQELQPILAPLGKVIGLGRDKLNLAEPTQIRQVVREIKPDIIVNAGAYTAVDKAETDSELANSINAVAPTILAEEAGQLGARLIHISTDYVFDGEKNTPYTEEDYTNPINVYGKSKLGGEEGIRQTALNTGGELDYVIIRTAWVYGTYGKGNFVKTMLRLGKEREEIRVVADQVGTPTWTKDIAEAIAKILSFKSPVPTRIYHFTNSGVASWYDFAVAIFEEAKLLGFPLKVEKIVPISTPEYPTPAKRPAYSVLSTKKISTVLENHPPHWRQGLRNMLQQLKSRPK
ncbi:MAG: dTDP-4-dehydrorhamnose reductase [Moorea sp. SIO2B7]|nr:dTDP-4-dehydrorhamnose reductase [Moorena sp. SIO2B7]